MSRQTRKLIHLSDLHFGTEEPHVLAALEQAIAGIRPDLVIVSGDLTQRARSREFRAARDFLERLPAASLVVPGNHDIPLYNPMARALWPFRRYSSTFGKTSGLSSRVPPLNIIGINTARPERHASGRITARQRRLVIDFARQAGTTDITVVVLHHPLIVENPQDSVATVEHGRSALNQWRKAGVDLILSGHVHHPFLICASVSRPEPPWMLNAGTAISHRRRHGIGNSFNVIECPLATAARHLVIERWDHDGDESGFACKLRHELDLGPRSADV